MSWKHTASLRMNWKKKIDNVTVTVLKDFSHKDDLFVGKICTEMYKKNYIICSYERPLWGIHAAKTWLDPPWFLLNSRCENMFDQWNPLFTTIVCHSLQPKWECLINLFSQRGLFPIFYDKHRDYLNNEGSRRIYWLLFIRHIQYISLFIIHIHNIQCFL